LIEKTNHVGKSDFEMQTSPAMLTNCQETFEKKFHQKKVAMYKLYMPQEKN